MFWLADSTVCHVRWSSLAECEVHYCQQYFLWKCSGSQISATLLTHSIACFFPPPSNPCSPVRVLICIIVIINFLIAGKRVSLLNRHKKHQCCITLSFSVFAAFSCISSAPSKLAVYIESMYVCVCTHILLSLTSQLVHLIGKFVIIRWAGWGPLCSHIWLSNCSFAL